MGLQNLVCLACNAVMQQACIMEVMIVQPVLCYKLVMKTVVDMHPATPATRIYGCTPIDEHIMPF